MLRTKIVSSLEKVFLDQKPEDFARLERISALKGERVSFQLIVYQDGPIPYDLNRLLVKPTVKGALAEHVTLREVRNVPVELPCRNELRDEQVLRTTPGLYPDKLAPLTCHGRIIAKRDLAVSVWVDVNIPKDTKHIGESAIEICLESENEQQLSESITIDVINATLPEQELILTQWFHCDSLANYYRVEPWSEEHWRIVENFARVAVKNGINMLLTPVFTPSLDTEIGGERLTTQLVGVTKTGSGYSFDFTLLDRWVDMCDRIGIKYFEISHLFTQWGATHAPKIMATVDGEYKRIFGWETDAVGDEYTTFIRAFLAEFIAHMKKNGNDKRCYYHISDEPTIDHLESYSAAKNSVADLLEGYTIMDALSDYDFWRDGVVDTPIPSNDHIKPFIENNVPGLWTYYCCGQLINVSNRLIYMPSWRNRSIGMQMYKYNIVGFLQWGYNFYNNRQSMDSIDPNEELGGGHWVPAGDTHSVYPAADGTALESLRIVVFHDAIQDISAMKLCESLYSKEEVIAAMESILGASIAFDRCAYTAFEMQAIREKINAMIKAKV